MAAPSHPPASAPTLAPTAAPPPAPIAVPLPGVAHPARATTKTTNTKDFRIKIPSTVRSLLCLQSHDFFLVSPLHGSRSSLVVSSAPRSRVSRRRTGRSVRASQKRVDGELTSATTLSILRMHWVHHSIGRRRSSPPPHHHRH